MQVVLVMFRSDGERRSFSVTRDVTVIGRREDCDLRIPLTEVSRKHCRILRDGETLRVEDLGSSNGTYHNGQRIQDAEVAPGDTIKVGPVVFCIQIDGLPAEEDMTPILPAEAEPEHESDGSTDNSSELSPRESMQTSPPLPMEEHEEGVEEMQEELPEEDELHPTPPPLPVAHDDEPLPLEEVQTGEADSFALEVEETAGAEDHEEGQVEGELEDFDIVEEDDEPHDSQSGDIAVDSEHK